MPCSQNWPTRAKALTTSSTPPRKWTRSFARRQLKEIARLYGEGRYQEAWDLAYRIEQDLRRVADLTHEEQMYRDADLLREYQDTFARWVQRQTGRRPGMPTSTPVPERAGESEAYDSPFAAATAPVLDVE